MADDKWWWNRAGAVAPVSNPGSAVPNYGLTYDLATAPYDGPDEFDAIAQALSAFASQAGAALGRAIPRGLTGEVRDKTVWDNLSSGAGWVKDQTAGVLGVAAEAADEVRDAVGLDGVSLPGGGLLTTFDSDQFAGEDAEGWDRFQQIGGGSVSASVGAAVSSPIVREIFWGLEKLNEYASTAALATTLAEDDISLLFEAGTWGDANQIQRDYGLTFGEAFAQTFYDKEVLLDAERFEQIRQHNTAFNFAALGANVIAAWRMDPNVLVGKQIGQARDLAVGKLGTSVRSAEVQRSILSQPDMDSAKAAASEYKGVDRLRAAYSVSLYDRSLALREAAKEMNFESFVNQPSFRNSASGTVMAKLMQDVAHDDDAWNLVFRSAIGDPDAVGELIARGGEVSDKIAAIELKTMPKLQRDLERTEARYQKRLAEQGRPQDARIEITRVGDSWLEDDITDLRAKAAEIETQLAGYASHESWIKRALPGLDEGEVGRYAPNSVFGNLDRIGKTASFRDLGGKVEMWQHDAYSPMTRVLRAPTKPFLKRVGVVSLNDVDEGAAAITGYLDQIDFIANAKQQGLRDNTLAAFAGATTDMQRKVIAERLERDGIAALGAKHNLSPELMEEFGKLLQEKRRTSWSRLTDQTLYSPIPGREGPGYVDVPDANGNVIDRIKMPVDPTELANYHSLTNLTDLDRTIRRNLDLLRSMDTELVSMKRAGIAKGERWVANFADEIGSTFNQFWKPLALISIRWPARVVADESIRVMLLTGVLPHLAGLPVGVKNAAYNTGVVRPTEWWKGRKVKTGSLAEESLRAGSRNDFDPYDYRAITNPTAAVPLDEVDLGKLDTKRYDRLNSTTAKRWAFLSKEEFSRAQTREARKTSDRVADSVAAFTEPERPGWARQWDERLAEAETSPERGFFFDPVSHRALKKGFAVSVYPGRLRTFESKPSARDLNYWTEKNSDLLAVPTNRVAVWRDKDTGRWHLDVVKTTKRREDAMLLASRAEATEFYDIEDGFTRFMSEDFYGHFSSPFTKPDVEPNPPGGAAFDQAPLTDEAGAAIGAGMSLGQGPTRKKIGFGQKTWRTRDGRKVTGEQMYGPDTDNANVYYGVVSSRDAMRNLYGGHTRSLGATRAKQDWRTFQPDDAGWGEAYTDFVNNHVRYSPLMQRMLDGQTDDEIFDWLMGTAKGRELRQRIPLRGSRPEQWVSDVREVFDHVLSTEAVREAARLGDLTPEMLDDLLPNDMRGAMHGDGFKLALGDHHSEGLITRTVNKTMEVLGSMPTDALVRHPFAARVYDREMRNYLASVPADKITNNVLKAAEASARAKAVRQVRRTLYNIADEREGVYMLRFVSPFFQAQVEVLERYARISMEKPETIARIAQLLAGSQVLPTGLWEVVDREGNPVEGYSGDNQVTFQVTPTLRALADKIPGLQGALDNAGDIQVPVASLNLILQGDKPYLPSMGPLVTYPLSEFVFQDRPDLSESALYEWAYPFGQPRGGNFAERAFNTLAPAYMRRGLVWGTEDMSDPAFARRVSEIGAQQLFEWERSGREGERPTEREALEAAKNEYRLRAFSSFFLPAPVTPRSPFQFWIDQRRVYQEKYGLEADERFYQDMGPDYFMFAQQATRSIGGMGPNVGEYKAFKSYRDLAEQAPMLIGVLTGPFATDEFSDAVYQWQLNQKVSPAASSTLRERLSPAERIAESEVSRGWVEYNMLASALDAELRNRQAAGGSATITSLSNSDLAQQKALKIQEIIERNPAWQDAFNSRQSTLGAWLEQAYSVMDDERLDGRTDIEALRAYLIGRARLQDALIARANATYAATGQRPSDQLSFTETGEPTGDNADLGAAWLSWVTETKAANPLFAEIYNRYLEGDDLSVYIPPEVSSGY